MNISQNHPNRQPHNWLIYDINDQWIEKYSELYTGSTYDLGCGEAPYKSWFLTKCDNYVGVDWSSSYHNVSPDIVASLNEPLPIESEVADTVLSFSVMEHLFAPQQMLSEAFRILKPGGSFIAQVPWQWGIHESPYDFFRYTPFGLKHLLSQAGFKEINIEAQSGVFTMLTMKFNYMTRRLIGGPKIVRFILNKSLICIWYLAQKLAPVLDKLDKNWDIEASGYFVTAKKPKIK